MDDKMKVLTYEDIMTLVKRGAKIKFRVNQTSYIIDAEPIDTFSKIAGNMPVGTHKILPYIWREDETDGPEVGLVYPMKKGNTTRLSEGNDFNYTRQAFDYGEREWENNLKCMHLGPICDVEVIY